MWDTACFENRFYLKKKSCSIKSSAAALLKSCVRLNCLKACKHTHTQNYISHKAPLLQHVGEVPQPQPTAGVFFTWQCFGQCQRAPAGNRLLGHDAGDDHLCGLRVGCIGVWPPRCLAEGSLALRSSPLPSVQGQGAAAGEFRGLLCLAGGLHGFGGRGGCITALCKSLLASQRHFQPHFLQPVDLICVYLYIFLVIF